MTESFDGVKLAVTPQSLIGLIGRSLPPDSFFENATDGKSSKNNNREKIGVVLGYNMKRQRIKIIFSRHSCNGMDKCAATNITASNQG